MANLVGMDVEVVEKVGRQLKGRASEMHALSASISTLVDQLQSVWSGQDAIQFKGWWEQQHRPALERLRAAIDGLGQSVLSNAAEQHYVSSGASGERATVSPAAPPSGLSAEQYATRVAGIETLLRDYGIEPLSLGVEAADLYEGLAAVVDPSEIGSLKDLGRAVNELKPGSSFRGAGGALSLLGIGLSAKDFTVAQGLGTSRPPGVLGLTSSQG